MQPFDSRKFAFLLHFHPIACDTECTRPLGHGRERYVQLLDTVIKPAEQPDILTVTPEDIDAMTVVQLEGMLRRLGKVPVGSKQQLRDRLREALETLAQNLQLSKRVIPLRRCFPYMPAKFCCPCLFCSIVAGVAIRVER